MNIHGLYFLCRLRKGGSSSSRIHQERPADATADGHEELQGAAAETRARGAGAGGPDVQGEKRAARGCDTDDDNDAANSCGDGSDYEPSSGEASDDIQVHIVMMLSSARLCKNAEYCVCGNMGT